LPLKTCALGSAVKRWVTIGLGSFAVGSVMFAGVL
jgi:hypothetical protein